MDAAALDSDNLYTRLGIESSATADEIKRAYRALIRQFSPERAPEEFKRLREAYETLSDRASRAAYDAQPDPLVVQWLETAHQAMSARDYDVAERYFKQVLVREPDLGFVRNFLGLCFMYQEQPANALVQFERLLKDPEAPASWFANAGHAYRQLGRKRDAFLAFREAIRRAGDNPVDYVTALADVYLDENSYEAAAEELERGINADGAVDFDDLGYFTKLLEVHARERSLPKFKLVLARMKAVATTDAERRSLAFKLAGIAQSLIAAKAYDYALPSAQATRALQPDDDDYVALDELTQFLAARDLGGAERLVTTHPSFASDGWLAATGYSMRAFLLGQSTARPVTSSAGQARAVPYSAPSSTNEGPPRWLVRWGIFALISFVIRGLSSGTSTSSSPVLASPSSSQYSATPSSFGLSSPPTSSSAESQEVPQGAGPPIRRSESSDSGWYETERGRIRAFESRISNMDDRISSEESMLKALRRELESIESGSGTYSTQDPEYDQLLNRYNLRVRAYNSLLRDRGELYGEYKSALDAFNAKVAAHNSSLR